MNSNIDKLKKNLSEIKDRKLIEMLNIDYADYTEDTIRLVKEELANRNIPNFIISHDCKNSILNNNGYILFRDLYLQIRYEDVFKYISKLKPSSKSLYNEYEKMFNELLYTKILDNEGIYISVEIKENIFNPKIKDREVFGQDIDTHEKFEMDFLEWGNWMSSIVDINQVNEIGKECYMAYCLNTMTKHGLSQDEITEQYNNLKLRHEGNEVILENEIELEKSIEEVHPWLRLWARTIDYTVLVIIFGYILSLMPTKFFVRILSLDRIIYVIPFIWIIIETILLATVGTTLGKWVLNIRVQTSKGNMLSIKDAFLRSSLVWIIGLGFGIRYIQVITQFYSYFKLSKNGITVWDEKTNAKVIHGEIGVIRVIVVVMILIIRLIVIGF